MANKGEYTEAPKTIWENWTIKQRYHFLKDHKAEIQKAFKKENKNTSINAEKWASVIYPDLDRSIQKAIFVHVSEGKYSLGGSTDNDEYYQTLINMYAIINDLPRKHMTAEEKAKMAEDIQKDGGWDDKQVKGFLKYANQQKEAAIEYSKGGGVDESDEDSEFKKLYGLFPKKHLRSKKAWASFSKEKQDRFIDYLNAGDVASEHIADSWLEFVNAKSVKEWRKNATDFSSLDEPLENGEAEIETASAEPTPIADCLDGDEKKFILSMLEKMNINMLTDSGLEIRESAMKKLK